MLMKDYDALKASIFRYLRDIESPASITDS